MRREQMFRPRRRILVRGLRGYAELPSSASLPPGGVMENAPVMVNPVAIESPITLSPILPQPVAERTQPGGVIYSPRAPWIEPPEDAESIDPIDFVALGAQGTTTVILAFTVPEGRDGVIKLFGNVAFGAGWTEGTGELVWRIQIDGQPVRNYSNIRASLGNVSNPAPVGGKAGIRIFEGNLVEVVVVNAVAPGGVPGNPIVSARMGGWYYSKTHDQSGW